MQPAGVRAEWRDPGSPVMPFSYLQPVLADIAVRLHNCEGVLLAVMAGACSTRLLWVRAQGSSTPTAMGAGAWELALVVRRGDGGRRRPSPSVSTREMMGGEGYFGPLDRPDPHVRGL